MPIEGALTLSSLANWLCDMSNFARRAATALPVTGRSLETARDEPFDPALCDADIFLRFVFGLAGTFEDIFLDVPAERFRRREG